MIKMSMLLLLRKGKLKMYNYLLIASVLLTIDTNLFNLWSSAFVMGFSEKTLKKLRVKEGSFLRKIIPFRTGYLKEKKWQIFTYRECSKICAIPYLISLILGIVVIPISIIDIFIDFIPDLYLKIAGVLIPCIVFLRLSITNICSQVLHL